MTVETTFVAMPENKVVHHNVFEMGVAPYRLTGVWSAPSKGLLEANPNAYNNAMALRPTCCNFTCAHCGTPILHHFIIKDAEGKFFAIGSSCVERLGDTALISAVKAAELKRKRELNRKKREAEREAKRLKVIEERNAREEAERAANGGLTDAELEEAKRKLIKTFRKRDLEDAVAYFARPLAATEGYFAKDVLAGLKVGNLPAGRGIDIVLEIASKHYSNARKNSKAYNAEHDKAVDLWNELVNKVEEVKACEYKEEVAAELNQLAAR
jgi:hypothetical protein